MSLPVAMQPVSSVRGPIWGVSWGGEEVAGVLVGEEGGGLQRNGDEYGGGKKGRGRGRTMRGFIERGTSLSHCLHLADVALAKRGTPQLFGGTS